MLRGRLPNQDPIGAPPSSRKGDGKGKGKGKRKDFAALSQVPDDPNRPTQQQLMRQWNQLALVYPRAHAVRKIYFAARLQGAEIEDALRLDTAILRDYRAWCAGRVASSQGDTTVPLVHEYVHSLAAWSQVCMASSHVVADGYEVEPEPLAITDTAALSQDTAATVLDTDGEMDVDMEGSSAAAGGSSASAAAGGSSASAAAADPAGPASPASDEMWL